MAPEELERYLHEHIPLTRAMAVSVASAAPESIVLSAPLAPNINHRETVFGGSASALAILAAWSLLLTRMRGEGVTSRLVIQRNSMEYKCPITGEFTASASLARPDKWSQFMTTLARKGKSRVTVESALACDRQTVGHFRGEFVALSYTQES
ncbi:MAG: YiiD C-terminal domain-containing protein [Xanthomonadales bacterium]|nr:YiiD C-terminal domain-containing protein [Xanthomonadales bacterium]